MLIEQNDTKTSPNDKLLMSLSAYSIQGKRNHMEDFYDIGYQMKPCDQRRPNEWPYEYFYFGIFDGHGGSEAASFAKRNLLKFITRQKDFWSSDDEDVMRAIRQGFAETHATMKKEMGLWSRTSRVLPSTAGTTASVLFIRNGKFYTGHVGDSRIVICQENPETKHWISRQITEDHKPEQEVERIQRAGGDVKSKIGVHRVVWRRPVLTKEMETKLIYGIRSPEYNEYTKLVSAYPVSENLVESYQIIPFLAIARSLGDFWSLNSQSGQYVVSPEPDITCRPITPHDTCILLATDGLWNVINSSQAVRFLQELSILKNNKRQYHEDEYFATDNFYDVAGIDSENHAQSLVYFAYQIWERRRLRSDNITVVVAMLHDILAQFHKTTSHQQPPNKSPYTTRASIQQEKVHEKVTKEQLGSPKLTQLGQTNSYMEKIRLNRKPIFLLTDSYLYNQKWQRLESFLVLPPTLLEQEYNFAYPKLVYPRNYMRLSVAACRKISQYENHLSDSFIYIKRVSDDPSDERELPTRISSKTGKEVKDASAQATQSIHDFGQPWDQLLDEEDDEEEEEEEEEEGEAVAEEEPFISFDLSDEFDDTINMDESDVDDCLNNDGNDDDEGNDSPSSSGSSSSGSSGNGGSSGSDSDSGRNSRLKGKDFELVLEHELTADELSRLYKSRDLTIKDHSSRVKNIRDKEKKSIPQLRCLLNYTPPVRRSPRSAYLSVSDNSKRKNQSNTDANGNGSSTPNAKRRKSQPARCYLTRSQS